MDCDIIRMPQRQPTSTDLSKVEQFRSNPAAHEVPTGVGFCDITSASRIAMPTGARSGPKPVHVEDERERTITIHIERSASANGHDRLFLHKQFGSEALEAAPSRHGLAAAGQPPLKHSPGHLSEHRTRSTPTRSGWFSTSPATCSCLSGEIKNRHHPYSA
ncbi:hypothetical protein ACIRG5_19270 [Lentzea sp. NPDC102401]|uniref:hypothetical protein n=1 Tax=Lentzea sp. NPDC102401 TaxID=3364128 RepID=UPI003814A8DF